MCRLSCSTKMVTCEINSAARSPAFTYPCMMCNIWKGGPGTAIVLLFRPSALSSACLQVKESTLLLEVPAGLSHCPLCARHHALVHPRLPRMEPYLCNDNGEMPSFPGRPLSC